LGHSWQLIAANDGFGLGQVIKQGSEGNTFIQSILVSVSG
jgi:hypothetical protein